MLLLQLATLTTEASTPSATSTLSNETLVLLIGLAALGLGIASFFVIRALAKKSYRRQVSLGMVTLLIRVPKEKSEKDKTDEVTIETLRQDIATAETLFATIGGLRAERGPVAWFRGRKDHLSFEIVSRGGNIYFYALVSRRLKNFLVQQIHAQFPHAQIDEVEDYNFFGKQSSILGAYITLKKPFSYPIKSYQDIDSDPLSGLTNPLSKFAKTDGAAIQYVVRSSKRQWRRKGITESKRIQKGKHVGHGKGSWGKALGSAINKPQEDSPTTNEPYRMTANEEEMTKRMEQKVSKAGLDVNIRIVVSATNDMAARQHLDTVLNAFSQFNQYHHGNSFRAQVPRRQTKLIQDFIYRSFASNYRLVLNTEEMTSLWHLPLPSTETPGIVWLGARKAPPPTNMPLEGLKLGHAVYRNEKVDVRMKRADRRRHVYTVGKSGSGKSVFMENLIIQDINNGEGVGVVDPNGDLIEHILSNIPEHRIDDVIVFDPSDLDRPVGLNMLEARTEDQKDFVVQEMISIFYKLFPPEMIGPMFEHQMRNVMLTLMADVENPGTIAEIPRMFSDDAFAKEWVAKLKDPVVRAFWEKEMAKTSDYHKSEMLGYLISKVGRFVENEMMRNIIGQTKSSFDFREVMDNKKILLVNLAKGKTGEVNAKLLGLIVVAKLQMAAFARAELAESERNDFYLYMDEFQNFITESIATILSEARKYRLNLTMAHQYMGQLVDSARNDSSVREAVLGNAGTICCFRIGPEDAEVLEKEFAPVFSAYDLINVEKYTAYVKMLIDSTAAKPFNMATDPPLPENLAYAQKLKELCRLKYGRNRKLVEREILERTQLGAADTMGTPPPVTPTV